MTGMSRRGFLGSGAGGITLVGASAISGRVQAAGIPEAPTMTDGSDAARRSRRRPARTTSPS